MEFVVILGIVACAFFLYRALRGSNASDLPIPTSAPPAVEKAEETLLNAPKRTKDAPGALGRWLVKDEQTQIHDLLIPGGLIYVGASLTKISGYGVEPALVNPRLPISVSDQHADMPYWPSYSEISPTARGEYLLWLSGGRQSSAANIGFIFLFLYGLERRALAEKSEVSETEWAHIQEEVQRLLSIYGSNDSFRRYASGFLGILRSTTVDPDNLVSQTPAVTKSYESANLELRSGLGWMATKGKPIPWNWALAWVRSHDSFYERTPAGRCPVEFSRLFQLRYNSQFGDGVILKPNKTRIKATYRPASNSFPGDVDLTIPELPDVTALKQPIEKFLLLANQCMDELDPYSRYLGRNPGDVESPAALGLLPPALIQNQGHEALDRIALWIRSLSFEEGIAVTTYASLRGAWGSLPAEVLAKRDCVTLSQCLQQLGYGIEPDIRFGSFQIRADGEVVLFALPPGAPTSPSKPYTNASLLAHLGAAVAHADGIVSIEEERALMGHALQNPELDAPEQLRLRAHMKWLLGAPPQLNGLKKRIESFPLEQKSALGAFLANVAGLDGNIAPAEIAALQRIYRQLGLDPQEVFAQTHAAATDPVVVQGAHPPNGFRIAHEPASPSKARVNLDRVKAMEAESDRVAVLLRDIFAESDREESQEPSRESEPTALVPTILGLDVHHSDFALSLLARDSWNRTELESVALRHHVMPDGAIDAINEAALDLHGEALLEGDDPIEVNARVRSEIQQ